MYMTVLHVVMQIFNYNSCNCFELHKILFVKCKHIQKHNAYFFSLSRSSARKCLIRVPTRSRPALTSGSFARLGVDCQNCWHMISQWTHSLKRFSASVNCK